MRCKTTARVLRRIPAGGGRGQVPGDRGACRGGEWTRRAGALGRHRVADRQGASPRVEVSATRCCSSTASRHQGSGWRRWPAACLGVAICWSTFRGTACRRPTSGGARRSASRRSTSSPACSTASASTRSRSWGTRSACSHCGCARPAMRVARAVIVGQPAVAIQGSRGDLTMGVLAAPVLGRVATWMAAALAATRGPLRPAAIGRSPRRAGFRRHRRPAPPLAAAARPGSIVSVAAAAAPRGSPRT